MKDKKKVLIGLSIFMCLLIITGIGVYTVYKNKHEKDRYYSSNISIFEKILMPDKVEKADTKSLKTSRVYTSKTSEEDNSVYKIDGKIVGENQDITEMIPIHLRPVEVKEEAEDGIDLMDLFGFRIAEAVPEEEKENLIKETLNSPNSTYLSAFTPEVVQKYAHGTFNWNYKNTENREDFLAFRRGTYFYKYKDDFLTADELYNVIHERIKKHKLKIDYEFSFKEKDIYINPTRGGFTLSGILKFKYKSDNGSKIYGYEPGKWYELNYEVDFNWNIASETDNWKMWDNGATGLSVSQDYVIK